MRPDGGPSPHDRPPRTGRRLELFHRELVETPSGPRYYLRVTRLAVLLIVGLTAVAMAAIIFLFLSGRSSLRTPARIELKPPPEPSVNINSQVIKPMPPPPRRPTPQPAQGQSSPTAEAGDSRTDPAVINTAPTTEGRNRNAGGGRATPERPERE